MSQRPPTDEDTETAVFDGQGLRPKRPTARGVGGNRAESLKEAQRRRAVELATPTEITGPYDRSEPIRVISMKTPEEIAPDVKHPTPHVKRPKLRSLSSVTPTTGARMGHLAPPRDPKGVRARKLRDVVVWGSVVIIVGCAVMLGVWFLARS